MSKFRNKFKKYDDTIYKNSKKWKKTKKVHNKKNDDLVSDIPVDFEIPEEDIKDY